MLKGALVIALSVLAIGVQTVLQSEAVSDSGRQGTFSRLMPPSLRLAPVNDESAFFAEIEQLKIRLDRDRIQALADGADRP
jgi:hypothetical protein